MKYLPTMSIKEFRDVLPKCNFSVLKQLMEGIYEIKRNHYKNIKDAGNPFILDIERKETMILNAMQGRGVDTKSQEFFVWMKRLQNRADKILVVR